MVRRKDLVQAAYDYILRKIKNNEYLPNEQIKELDISNALDISRTPVRKALKRLEEEKFIQIEPFKGAQVTEQRMTNDDVQDRYQFLEILMTYHFQKLEQKEIDYDTKPLKKQLEMLETEMIRDKNKDYLVFEELEIEFWEKLLINCDNDYIKASAIQTIRPLVTSKGRIQKVIFASRRKKLEHYRELIHYLTKNNYALARREIRILFNQINLNMIQGLV